MKVLVTGGAGFIGSNIVDGLLTEGHEVVVVDNFSTGKSCNLNSKARFYEMDICDPNLEEIFRREGFDFVDHHAAQIDVRHSVADPVNDARVNILGLLNILENCRRFAVKGVVFASSGGVVYGEPEDLPVDETAPKGPFSPYGVSKLSSEFYLAYYSSVFGLPYVALRYGNVYGPRQDPWGEAGVVAIFGLKMLRGETPMIYGDGEQVRDYVYVGDVVRANILALERLRGLTEQAGGGKPVSLKDGFSGCAINEFAFNIATGEGISVNRLFAVLQELTEFTGKANYGPERIGELRKIFLDAQKACEKLGWKPEKSLSEGLRHTVAYLAKNL